MQMLYTALDRSVTKLGFAVVLALLGVVGGTIGITVNEIVAISGQGILDFELGHSVARINEILGAYGGEGIALYQRVQMLDLVNPFLYSWLSAMLIHLLVKESRCSWFVFIPLLPGIFDYIENYYLYQFVSTYPVLDSDQVAVANVLSLLKRGVLFLAIGTLVFAGTLKMVAVIRK